jgi:hypothetical protein
VAPILLILGTDAVTAARPATAVQLMHACLAVGFDGVYPLSWGDELVAAEAMRQVDAAGACTVVACTCPRVRTLIERTSLPESFATAVTVAPPVAAARYLRRAYFGGELTIAYAGGCPSGADPEIDIRYTPDALFDLLRERAVDTESQPLLFDSMLPPDRRRWCSLPGGLPTPDALARLDPPRAARTVPVEELVALAPDRSTTPMVVDLAPAAGCVCTGHRDAVLATEPPRAMSPVVDGRIVDLRDVAPVWRITPPRATVVVQPEPPAPRPSRYVAPELTRVTPPRPAVVVEREESVVQFVEVTVDELRARASTAAAPTAAAPAAAAPPGEPDSPPAPAAVPNDSPAEPAPVATAASAPVEGGGYWRPRSTRPPAVGREAPPARVRRAVPYAVLAVALLLGLWGAREALSRMTARTAPTPAIAADSAPPRPVDSVAGSLPLTPRADSAAVHDTATADTTSPPADTTRRPDSTATPAAPSIPASDARPRPRTVAPPTSPPAIPRPTPRPSSDTQPRRPVARIIVEPAPPTPSFTRGARGVILSDSAAVCDTLALSAPSFDKRCPLERVRRSRKTSALQEP